MMARSEDRRSSAAQLGREPRGLRAVAHRCPCGLPDVVETAPRLPDGTPFPTLYYLTCPRAAAAISGLEAAGLMREMTARLAEDAGRPGRLPARAPGLPGPPGRRGGRRTAWSRLPPGTQSAGGMPDRVKCLHVLAAHELAVPGANPLGREALDGGGTMVVPRPLRDRAGRARDEQQAERAGVQASDACRVAAIDCGTNSIRLLIADLGPRPALPALTDVTRQMKIVRLGEGVDRTGRLSPAALDRTFGALREYAGLIGALSVDAVRMVATSATRDAGNRRSSPAGSRRCSASPRRSSPARRRPAVLHRGDPGLRQLGAGPTYLVTDIGGGSTEFVLGAAAPRSDGHRGARSVDIGCVRMTERHLHGDPPTARRGGGGHRRHRRRARPGRAGLASARRHGASGDRSSAWPARSPPSRASPSGWRSTTRPAIHHSRVSAERVPAIAGRLLAQTRAERAAIAVMHPGRVDVIGAGALILARIMDRFGFAEVLVSEHDILDGIAWSLGGR